MDDPTLAALIEGSLPTEDAVYVLARLLNRYSASERDAILEKVGDLVIVDEMHLYAKPPELRPLSKLPARFPALLRELESLPRAGGTTDAADVEAVAPQLRTTARGENLISLVVEDRFVYPSFQFQEDSTTFEPRTSVTVANRNLLANRDPWGALAWWLAQNGRIGSRRPIDLLDTADEESVARLAAAVAAPLG